MNGVASRTCLQTYIIWNLDRSCTFPRRICWSCTLLPASVTAKRCIGLRKGFTRPSSIYHNGLRLYLNIRARKVVANTWGVVNFVATMLSVVQNTPFSTEYNVHLLEYDSQWSSYLSLEKPVVKLFTVELKPCLDRTTCGARGRLCVYANVFNLLEPEFYI